MSFVALVRTMMQAFNIPVVMLESDRNENDHCKRFSMNQIKILFRVKKPYGRTIKNKDIETSNDPFLGTIVISQNAAVEGAPQIISRIVKCAASKAHFNNETYARSLIG